MKNYAFLALAFIVSLASVGCARQFHPPVAFGGVGAGAYGGVGYGTGFMPGATGAISPYGGSVYAGTTYDPRSAPAIAAYDQARYAARWSSAPAGAPVVVASPACTSCPLPEAATATSASTDSTTPSAIDRALVRQVIDMEDRLETLESSH